jgi:hypothetical protein
MRVGMRKYHRTQILSLLQTIRQAQTAGEYAACQEGALSLCDFIDQKAGQGTKTVTLLESYCELLFKVHKKEENPKILYKHFTNIESTAKNELKPTRLEVAFISYKAAMSDSLESIYLAAKADPACDAYWVPVPYYDKNPDGTFGTMYYEGADHYGDHIEITDWQTYDIETRRPDAIYTFNPYDNIGYVTSIHPNFYCERLKTLTDMLIYVPYFVVGDESKISVEYLWGNPGILHATQIIVQSQTVKQNVIKGLKQEEKSINMPGVYGNLDKKFLPLGSPKFDKVLNTKKEDVPLPPEWERIINGRKVILYNTSIGSITEHGEKCLIKIRAVLDLFKNRQDVALWWRPHPLSVSTYKALQPGLANEYEKMVADYKREGWGVLDETADLHRAIAWSDAYYGDISSVMLLYNEAKKPIMICDASIYKDNDSAPFFPAFFYSLGSEILAFSKHYNVLFLADDSGSLISLGDFSGEDNCTSNATYYIPAINSHRLYFPPLNAHEIGVYSLSNKKFDKVPYDYSPKGTKPSFAFWGAITYGKFVFFTPCRYPAIMRLNTETNEIDYYTDWIDSAWDFNIRKQGMLFLPPLVVGNSIWISSYFSNILLEFNMDSQTHIKHNVGKNIYRYSGIAFDGDSYWLCPWFNTHTPLIKWNPGTGEINEFFDIYQYCDDNQKGFIMCTFSGGYIWLFSQFAEMVLRINIKTHEMLKIVAQFKTNKVSAIHDAQHYLLICDESDNKFIKWDYKENKHTETHVFYTNETRNNIEIKRAKALFESNINKSFYHENTNACLNVFITHILFTNDFFKKLTLKDKSFGDKTYLYMKNEVFS